MSLPPKLPPQPAIPVLVTGGAGYVGSHACKELARSGYWPVVYDHMLQGNRWAVQWGPCVEADVRDTKTLLATLRQYNIQAVLHFAALTSVAESVAQPLLYYQHNVLGTLSVLEAMQQAGIAALVFSSSCAVYGKTLQTPIDETQRLQPSSPYGHSKLTCEFMLADFRQAYQLQTVALRYFNAAGADWQSDLGEAHAPETHLLPLAIQAALGRGPPVTVYGQDHNTFDGSCIRDYVHVSDLARGHVLALQNLMASSQPACSGQAYNLGTGQGHSVQDVLATVQRVTGQSVPRLTGARRAGDAAILVAESSKAMQELNWAPSYSSLEEIVKTALAWELKRQL